MKTLLRAALAAGMTLVVAAPVASAATYAVDTTADPLAPLSGCTPAANDCSLRGAITKANGTAGVPDTITIPAGTYVLSATTALPDITDDLTITGAGARSTIIDGADGQPTIFAFGGSGSSALTDLTVRNGGPSTGGDSVVGNGGGSLAVSRVAITGNRSYALTNFGSGLDVSDSTVSGNTTPLAQGVLNAPSSNTGIMTIRRSTIANNTASGDPSSSIVLASGVLNTCVAFISDSTISGNVAGDATHAAFGGSLVALDTVEDASSPHCGIVATTIRNTIVTDGSAGGAPQNCFTNTPIQSVGHNLDSDGTCGFRGTGDLSNVSPGLSPLADNGGPTDTMLPTSAASLVVDAGAGCTATDQRGSARPQGGACDIGAAESSFTAPPPPAPAPPPTTTTVTVTTPAPPPVAAQSAPDATPAKLRLSGLPAKVKRSVLAKGLKLRVSASEPVSLDAKLYGAPKKVTLRSLFNYVLAQASAPKAAGARTVTLKPAKALPGRRPVKLRVVVVATDGGGNRTTALKTITVT